MSLQEAQQSDTRTDGDRNMLINNGYRSQPAWWFPVLICCYKDEDIKFARWVIPTWRHKPVWKAWKRPENQEDDQKEFEYQISLIKEKRQETCSRLLRKSSVVEDLLYSSKNMIDV